MRLIAVATLAMVALIFPAVQSHASNTGFEFEIRNVDGTSPGPFSIDPFGAPIELSVVLKQVDGGNDLATLGLLGFGFRFTFSDPNSSIAAVVDAGHVVVNPAFSAISTIDLLSGHVDVQAATFDPVFAQPGALLRLATIRVTPLGIGTVTLNATDIPDLDSTALGDGRFLDQLLTPDSTTLSTVPEPSTLAAAVVGLLGTAIAVVRRRGGCRRSMSV